MSTANDLAELQRVLQAEIEDDLAEYYAGCNDSSSDDEGANRTVGRKSHAATLPAGMPPRLSLKQEPVSQDNQQDASTNNTTTVVSMVQQLRGGATGLPATKANRPLLLCCEMLSVVRQLPCTYFDLQRGASGVGVWEVTKRLVKEIVHESELLDSGIMLVVNNTLDLANDARRLQHAISTAVSEQLAAPNGIVGVAHSRSFSAVLDCFRRVVEVLDMRLLTLQRDMLHSEMEKRVSLTPAELFLRIQQWMVIPRRCLNIFRSGVMRSKGTLADSLFHLMQKAQDSRDEEGFTFSSSLHTVAIWPYVELCVRTIFNDVQLEAREMKAQLPEVFLDKRYSERDVVSTCIGCEHVVAQVQSETVVRQACYDILNRLVAHATPKPQSKRPKETIETLQEVCGDDLPEPIEHAKSATIQFAGDSGTESERLNIVACFHPISFSTRIEDATCPDQERLAPLSHDFSVPCARAIFAMYLQPILELADSVQAKEVHKLLQTYLSAEQKHQADLHGEPPLVFRDVLRLLEDVALMGNWLPLQSGFVAPLSQNNAQWWSRHKSMINGTASPALSALFIDTVRQVQNGDWVSMFVLPERDAHEGRESIGRRIVRTLAAMRLDVAIPQRFHSVFPTDETREAYSATFCHITTLALAQRTLEMRWKVLHEKLKASVGTEAMREAGQCNAVLLFAFGAILRFVRHEYHVAITEFQQKLASGVKSVEELRHHHLEMVTSLLQTSFTTRGTQPLRVATESLVCLVLDTTLEAGYVVSRVKVAVGALLAAIQALPTESALSAKTKPLLQALTFNGFFADPSLLS